MVPPILHRGYEHNRVVLYLQRWLADWLMENNPNKPDVLGPDVIEPPEDNAYLYDDNAYSKDRLMSPSLSRHSTCMKVPDPAAAKSEQSKDSQMTMSSSTSTDDG